jgi:stage V sporulation protein B
MAVSIYNLPSTLVTAIALPLVPMLTAAIESYDKTRERSVISSSLKLTALVAFPAGLGISVFSKPILRLLFSSQVDEIEYTAPLLSLLGMSIFLSSMITVTNAILQAYKQVNKPIISMICGIVFKLILSYVLIGVPDINIYGAPISTFFSTVIIVAINLYFIIRNSGNIGSISKMFIKPFVASFLAVVLGVAAYLMTSVILDSKIAIILTILLVVLIYLIAIIKLKVIENEEILMLPGGKIIIKIFKKIHLV